MTIHTTANGLPPCPEVDRCEPHGGALAMSEDVNPDKNCCTVCTGSPTDNIWFQARAKGFPGRCILDEMTYEQVWAVLLRYPFAKRDMLRITRDPNLVRLANQTSLEVDQLDDDKKAANLINKNTLPFYTLFRGNMDGSI